MYTKLIKECERQINTYPGQVPTDEKFLKFAYHFLCKAEKVKPGKIYYFDRRKHTGKHFKEFKGGVCLERISPLFGIRRYRIYIERDNLWLLYLIHEFTHQLLMKEQHYYGHGKLFRKLHEAFTNLYFMPIFYLFDKTLK